MYKTLSAILFPVVTVVLIGTIAWGYENHNEKNAVLIRAENQYQRAFHELSYHMDHLHRELGNALAVNSTSQGFHRRCLINAWRLTNEAQANVNQLPLTGQLDDTEKLLSKISKFSYATAVRDLAKEPLSEKEMETLKTLVEQSKRISDELNNMQAVALSNHVSWLDVEAMNTGKREMGAHSLIDGFSTVNKTVSEYTEAGWGPAIMNMFDDHQMRTMSGRPYTEAQVKQKALQFLQLPESTPTDIVPHDQEGKFASYTVSVQRDDRTIQLEYAKQGGKLMWMMGHRDVDQSNLSLEEAERKAEQFLQQHGFGEMRAVNANEHDHVAYLTMVKIQDDMLLYPRKVAVYIALDDGEIIGLQAAEWAAEDGDITISPAALSLEEAKQKLNPSFEVTDHSLAVIENEMNENVLCYQFIGRINDTNYRIFINADTGLEEKLEQLL